MARARLTLSRLNYHRAATVLIAICFQLASSASGVASAADAQGRAKAITLKLGYFNGPAATCSSATPCQDVKPDVEKEYYTYLDAGYTQMIEKLSQGMSPEDFQKSLLDYYDGVAARDKVSGTCYGRCTNYDQPDMLWHATTETARNQKLDALIDAQYIYYGADRLVRNGMDVTSQIKDGLKRYRR